MTKRYTGGVVSSSLPTVNAAGASGVFLLSQQSDYQSRNAWPPYKIEESLRFRASATGYLSRTPSTAGNRKIMTLSCWVKRGILGGQPRIFSAGTDNYISFALTSDAIELNLRNGGSGSNVFLITTPVFRDPSAWYHIVMAIDTTQATASNRVKLYVNGVQITAFSTTNYPTQNNDMNSFNNSVAQYIGVLGDITYPFDGYMSEINFIDGQALTPSSFGATDKDGNWSPIAYTGTYGTNGFYVNFRDNTSATTMGYDYSGNGNNWTLSGFNVSTANTSYDIVIDVPSDQSDGTANNRGSYATLNPLGGLYSSLQGTLSNGNLTGTTATSDQKAILATMPVNGSSTDKWYWEVTATSKTSTYWAIGVFPYNINQYSATSGYSQYRSDGAIYVNTTNVATVASYTAGDVIGVTFDASNNELKYYKNGTLVTTQTVSNSAGFNIYPGVGSDNSGSSSVNDFNFGQRPFAYAPPSGFKTLNTFNLPEPTIKQPNQYFDTTLYTGDGTANRAITGLNFQPDLVWAKSRSATYYHGLFDPIRGGAVLYSNATDVEDATEKITFNSNGFTTPNKTSDFINVNAATYVAWQWNAGGANTTNTSGSITSIVRANQTAGFSIATYTGNGTGGATVGHGLGVAPSMVIVKRRNGVASWIVNHTSAGTGFLLLENDIAYSSAATYWTTAPTSSLLPTLTSNSEVNANGGTYVAYCFAPVAGYSAFGSYTGNGSSDGTFVYTGFRPKFVMFKRTNSTGVWGIWDTSRSSNNAATFRLTANGSGAELNLAATTIDILSNGVKFRTTDSDINASGSTYIYAAFAETPFKYARSR